MSSNRNDGCPAPPSAILETCVDVANLSRSRDFYSRVFGYPIMAEDQRFCAFNVEGGQVLLLFLRGSAPHGSVMRFGTIPAHGSDGTVHLGFRIPAESLGEWLARLEENGVAVESQFTWPAGGTSVYFRDPDGHLLELLTPGVWPSY